MVLLFVVTQCTLDKNLIFQETQTVRTLLKKKTKNPQKFPLSQVVSIASIASNKGSDMQISIIFD